MKFALKIILLALLFSACSKKIYLRYSEPVKTVDFQYPGSDFVMKFDQDELKKYCARETSHQTDSLVSKILENNDHILMEQLIALGKAQENKLKAENKAHWFEENWIKYIFTAEQLNEGKAFVFDNKTKTGIEKIRRREHYPGLARLVKNLSEHSTTYRYKRRVVYYSHSKSLMDAALQALGSMRSH